MSYILEALRKMERQRRHDAEPESWVEDLSARHEDDKIGHRSPGRVIIAASIFFGICGVLTGVLLYRGDEVPVPDERVVARVNPLPQPQKAGPSSVDQENKAAAGTRPASLVREGEPEQKMASLPPPRGVTLSEIREVQPTRPLPPEMAAAKVERALPPVLSDDVIGNPEYQGGKDVREGLPEKKEDTMEGAVLLKPRALLPEETHEAPSGNRTIDLTRKYKLTSTGEVNNRKYATIERNDYFIGDSFMGMTVSDIQRDRVYLMRDGSSRRYVIIFRY